MPKGMYKRQTKVQKQQVSQPVDSSPTRVWIELTERGVELKLIVGVSTNPNQVHGTLRITKNGLTWAKCNAKKKPEREISWDILGRLMGLGLA